MNQRLNEDERKEWAYTLYTKENHTISETAQVVNADEATVRNWISQGCWDTVKRSFPRAKATQLRYMYDLLERLNAKIATEPENINSKDVDLIVKYSAAIKNLEVLTPLHQVIEVTTAFVKWLRKTDPRFLKIVIPTMDEFVQIHARLCEDAEA